MQNVVLIATRIFYSTILLLDYTVAFLEIFYLARVESKFLYSTEVDRNFSITVSINHHAIEEICSAGRVEIWFAEKMFGHEIVSDNIF